MSKIANPVEYSIHNFIDKVYRPNPKKILFWDTCALLDIFRFSYKDGTLNTYQVLNKINGLIQSDTIISAASSLTITEWNNHEDTVKQEIENSLQKTGREHRTCIQVINEIFGSVLISESIHDKNLIQNLETLADDILSKTFFLQTDEIANNALERVRDKRPPASKKKEFQDCTIWETILRLSRSIYIFDSANEQVFFTVNTDDFIDKSREPRQFHGALLTEASMSKLVCCQNTIELDTRV